MTVIHFGICGKSNNMILMEKVNFTWQTDLVVCTQEIQSSHYCIIRVFLDGFRWARKLVRWGELDSYFEKVNTS